MSDLAYKTNSWSYQNGGLVARYVGDEAPEGTYFDLTNLESRFEGALSSRWGLSILSYNPATQRNSPVNSGPIHTLFRMEGVNGKVYWYACSDTLYRKTGDGPGAFQTFGALPISGQRLSAFSYRPSLSGVPYAYFADNQFYWRDNGTSGQVPWGMSLPIAPLTIAWSAVGAGRLQSSGGIGYDYRYTLYDINSGTESSPSVPNVGSFVANNQSATITPLPSPLGPPGGAAPTHWRLYRRGGTLSNGWYRVDTIPWFNSYVDNNPDSSIQNNPVLGLDIPLSADPPVTTTLSPPWQTTLTGAFAAGLRIITLGASVALFDGQLLNIGFPANLEQVRVAAAAFGNPGTQVQVYLQSAHAAGEPVSSSTRPATPMNVAAVAYDMAWLAGDPANPNILYYSLKFQPESFPVQNFVEVGVPSDPIVGLVNHRGILYVFTQQRIWEVAVVGSTVLPSIDTGVRHGLLASFAWTRVEGGIYYLSQDGAYFFNGSSSEYLSERVEWVFQGRTLGPLPVMAGLAGTPIVVGTNSLASLTANNTSGSTLWTSASTGDAPVANVSKLPYSNLIFPGGRSQTRFIAHCQLWSAQGSHLSFGYSITQTQVNAMVDDMRSRGVVCAVLDWYGSGSNSESSLAKLKVAVERYTDFYFAVMIDGNTAGVNGSTTQYQANLNYLSTHYFTSPQYFKIALPGSLTQKFLTLYFPDPNVDGGLNWTSIRATAAAVNALLIYEGNTGFSSANYDGGFSWIGPLTNGVPNTSENLSYLTSFYQAAKQAPAKLAIGSVRKGFNDNLASWGSNRILTQNNGGTWLDSFGLVDGIYTVPLVGIVTWDDYEESTEVETGILTTATFDMNFTKMIGTLLSVFITGHFTTTPGGAGINVLDHFEVWDSLDNGATYTKVFTTLTPNSFTFDTSSLPEGNHQFVVRGIAKPGIQNVISGTIFAPQITADAIVGYHNHEAFFSFKDSTGKRRRMIFHDIYKRWRVDTVQANAMYLAADLNLLAVSVLDDPKNVYQDRIAPGADWYGYDTFGNKIYTPIAYRLETPKTDLGVKKASKVFNELTNDFDSAGQAVGVQLSFDSGQTLLVLPTINSTGRRQAQSSINQGLGQLSLNAALILSGSSLSPLNPVTFYGSHIRAVVEAEYRQSFDSYWLKWGTDEYKFAKQGWWEFTCQDPQGIAVSVFLDGSSQAAFSFTLPFALSRTTAKIRYPAFLARTWRFVGTAAKDFQIYDDSQTEVKALSSSKGYQRQKLAP